MKHLLLPIIAGGALLPLSQVQAKTYGGLEPGQTFTLTVTEKETTRTRGDSVAHNIDVPDSMPDFKVGQKVKFTIGNKGQLTGPEFSISYESKEGRVNFYSNDPSFSHPRGEAATVTKTSSGKPTRATLTFYKFRFSGFVPITTTVHYVFD